LNVVLDLLLNGLFSFRDFSKLFREDSVLEGRGFGFFGRFFIDLFVEPFFVDHLELILEFISPIVVISKILKGVTESM
jgi:hypothetical protein